MKDVDKKGYECVKEKLMRVYAERGQEIRNRNGGRTKMRGVNREKEKKGDSVTTPE